MKLPIAARPQVISRFWAVIRRFPQANCRGFGVPGCGVSNRGGNSVAHR